MRVCELLNQLTQFPGHTHCRLSGELVVLRDQDRIPLTDPFTLQQVLNFLKQFDGDRPLELAGGLELDVGDGLQLLDTGQGLGVRAVGERDLPGGWNQPAGAPLLGGRRSSDPPVPALPSAGELADRAGIPHDRLAEAIEAFTALGRVIAEDPDIKAAGRRMIEMMGDRIGQQDLGQQDPHLVLAVLGKTVDELLASDAEIPEQARVELAIAQAALERAHDAFGFHA